MPTAASRWALPAAQTVKVPAGAVAVRDFAGPVGAPAIILLHGWLATADVNFAHCYAPLAEHFRVVSLDHRGHGGGIRTVRPFRLSDCADDAVAVADVLGVDRFVPVGYSLGGTIAQLVARRHADRVDGVVLCATAARFAGAPIRHVNVAGLAGLAALARLTPPAARRRLIERWFTTPRRDVWEPWALAIAESHDWRLVLEAGAALGAFNSTAWLPRLGSAAAVVVTARDEVIPPARQRELGDLIADARTFTIDAGHDAAVADTDRFVPILIDAISSVLRQRA